MSKPGVPMGTRLVLRFRRGIRRCLEATSHRSARKTDSFASKPGVFFEGG